MNMRPTGSFNSSFAQPTDKRIGDAFPIVEEVYKHLDQLKYLAENSDKLIGKQIEFRANEELQAIQWRYTGQDDWVTLLTYQDLVGVDLTQVEETLNQIIDNGVAKLTEDFQPFAREALKTALMVFDDYAAASAAAATLPDGQEIEAQNTDGRISRFIVQSGVLAFKEYVPDTIWLPDYAQLRAYSGYAKAVQIQSAGISGLFFLKGVVPGATDDSGTKILDTLGRLWERDFVGAVDPRWFGAKGNGTTDDTAAIAAANASGYGLEFGPGVYPCSGLSQTTEWFMHKKAWLLFNGSPGGFCVKVTGSDLDGSDLNVNGGGAATAPELLVQFLGTGNDYGHIRMSNLYSPSGGVVAAGVKFSSANNTVKSVSGKNFVNSGNANVSSPQLLTFGGGSSLCAVESVFGRSVQSGVLHVASGDVGNRVGFVDLVDAKDNGLYLTDGILRVAQCRYNGDDEPIVSIGGGLDLGTLLVDKAGGPNAVLGLNGSGLITIGEIILSGQNSASYIIRSRGTPTSLGAPVRIDSISGEFSGIAPFYVNEPNTLRSLSIGSVDVTHLFNSASFTGSWIRLDGVQELHLGKINFNVIDTTNEATTTTLRATINPTLLRPSEIGCFDVSIYKQSDYSESTRAFFADNCFQPMLVVDSAVINDATAAIRKRYNGTPSGSGIYAASPPTAGTWKKGQVIFRLGTNANSAPGWVCTTEGTPGVWKAMANVAA